MLNNALKAGHHRQCWLNSVVIFQGIRTSIAKKPYIFVFFQGGVVFSFPFVILLNRLDNANLTIYFSIISRDLHVHLCNYNSYKLLIYSYITSISFHK